MREASPAGIRQNATLYYAFGLLMQLAYAVRALPFYFTQEHPLRWVASGLVLAFLLLYLSERRISRRSPRYVHLYLALQSVLALALLLLPPHLFYAAVLGLVITAQAVMLLPRRQAYAWIGAMTASLNVGLVLTHGWFEGLSLGFLYIVAYLFTGAYAHMINRASASEERSRTLLSDLQRAHAQLKLYASHAEELAVVEERQRLARDLHDSVTQALYGLVLAAEAAARQLASGQPGPVRSQLQDIRAAAQAALREMRLLIFELRPPDLEQGLAAALQARLEAVERRAGLDIGLQLEGDGRLPRDLEAGLYRVAQEALNNVLRHAQAEKVSVRLQCGPETTVLEIADDGVGFDVGLARRHGGLGLRGMQERADKLGGRLLIASEPGAGTRVQLEVDRP